MSEVYRLLPFDGWPNRQPARGGNVPYAKLLFTWLVFLGGALAVKRGVNISIDAVVHLMPPVARRVVAAIGDFLALILFSVLIYYGILISSMTATIATPSLGVSVALVYAAAPVSAALMLIRHLRHIATTYFSPRLSRTRSDSEEGSC